MATSLGWDLAGLGFFLVWVLARLLYSIMHLPGFAKNHSMCVPPT